MVQSETIRREGGDSAFMLQKDLRIGTAEWVVTLHLPELAGSES